jgi:hypothetical protein
LSLTASVTVTADVSGEDSNAGPQSIGTVVNGNSPSTTYVYQLVAGNIALQFPLNTNLNYLLLDCGTLTSGQTLTIKGNTGDVGVQVSSSYPSLIPVSNTYLYSVSFTGVVNIPQQQIWLQATGPGSMKIGWF